MALVDCPNPKCNKGHEWQKGDEPCSCPTVKDWDDDHGWFGRVEHDIATCETLCPVCFGEECVEAEEAEEWIANQKGAA